MTKEDKKSIFTPERTPRFFIIESLAIAIASIILWPLFDLLFDSMRGNNFTWSVYEHLLSPIIFAIVITIIEFVFWNFFHKENK